jgi:hypothetical protein
MPKKYEAVRDSLMKSGYSEKRAKELAARTYNARRKPGQKPVTGGHKSGSGKFK